MERNTMERPNRSDVRLSMEEEAKIEADTRDYFDNVVPKRHTKPQRSDYSSRYVDALPRSSDGAIPELTEFQRLETDHQKLVYEGSKVEEEFVETEYYEDLNSVDKQHHTTGTGFIKMDNRDEKSYSLESDSLTSSHHSSMSNPATNDWIPLPESADYNGHNDSGKPNRSES